MHFISFIYAHLSRILGIKNKNSAQHVWLNKKASVAEVTVWECLKSCMYTGFHQHCMSLFILSQIYANCGLQNPIGFFLHIELPHCRFGSKLDISRKRKNSEIVDQAFNCAFLQTPLNPNWDNEKRQIKQNVRKQKF